MHCLIKTFAKQPLTNIQGPVTIVTGKKKRLTLIECNNDINSMIDIGKVADLILLLVDASFGFEMEIFEFLNICQVHGMPRVMGVLTHLDLINHPEKLKKTKKTLKHRFWTEVYAGAKLFYLSGLLYGEYFKNEVRNLARFITVMKFRPIIWRSTHPYILADRFEDLTQSELIRQNPKVNRTVSFYGYVRGVSFNKSNRIHIPGCGDMVIEEIMSLPDPCPLPEKNKKRSLVGQERLIYAPFSGVGGIVYDKDAVYVELGGSHSHHYMKEGSDLVNNILETQETLDKKMARSELQLFTNTEPLTSNDIKLSEINKYDEEKVIDKDDGRTRRKVIFQDNELETEKDNVEEDTEEEDNEEEVDGKFPSDNEDEEEDIDREVKKRKIPWETRVNEEKEIVANKKLKKTPKHLEKELNDMIGDFVNETQESEEDESDEDDNDDVMDNNEESLESENKLIQEKNIPVKYYKISNDKNEEIKNQISEVLSKISFNKTNENDLNESVEMENSDDEDEEDDDDDNEEDDDFEDEDEKSLEDTEEYGEELNESEEENDNDIKKAIDSSLKWKENLAQKASDAFLERQSNSHNLWKLVYGDVFENKARENRNEEEESDEIGGLFQIVNKREHAKLQQRDDQDQVECSKFIANQTRNWEDENNRLLIADCFVTGKWKASEDAKELLRLDDLEDDDDEMFGDFEDLETGEKHETEATSSEQKNEPKLTKRSFLRRKKLKEQFDAEYDDTEGGKTHFDDLKQEMSAQAQLNKSEFEGLDESIRQQLEGFRPGLYVRVQVSQVPCELIENFDPVYPLIIGGLNSGEENIGYVQVRMKKHRWYQKILKSSDPLIVSLGWRRFQTLPLYAKLEDNLRHRFLKYTPQHLACIGHMWGPVTIQGSGMLAIQDLSSQQAGFRIAATGTVIELDQSTQIMKKLKLTGVPMKIYNKTAFIQGMFNSSLEVAKFEGGKIKTVSGIRGQIKKAVNKPEGAFRATFEDKILLSDIVFCRTWYKVDIPKFYNPVTSLLLPKEEKNKWIGMKTTGQLKREKNVKTEVNPDHLYTDIERKPQRFKPLVIPKNLQRELPYKDKPKVKLNKKKNKNKNKSDGRVAVIREPKEQKIAKMMRMLKTSYIDKREKMVMETSKRMTEYKKKLEKEELSQLKRQKELRKQVFRTLSKMDLKDKSKK